MSAAPSLCSLAALTDEATLSPLVELTLGIGSEGGSNPCIPPSPLCKGLRVSDHRLTEKPSSGAPPSHPKCRCWPTECHPQRRRSRRRTKAPPRLHRRRGWFESAAPTAASK